MRRRAERTRDFTVFLTGGRNDLDLVRSTAARLTEHGLSCVLPLTADMGADPEPTEIRRDLNENLDSRDAVLLLFERGPATQVRQYVSEYRRSLARRDTPPDRFVLCQPHKDALAVGMSHPDLQVIVTSRPCDEGCAKDFFEGFET